MGTTWSNVLTQTGFTATEVFAGAFVFVAILVLYLLWAYR